MEALFQSIVDCINSTEVNLGNATYRLVVAMVLGTLVGAERKRKGQIAGVRTFALISMGACLAMLLSIYVPQVYLGLKNGDPGRIAAQVITDPYERVGARAYHSRRDLDDGRHRHGCRRRNVLVLDYRDADDSCHSGAFRGLRAAIQHGAGEPRPTPVGRLHRYRHITLPESIREPQYSSLDLFSAIRLYSQYNGHQLRGARTVPPELSADVRGSAGHQSDALADTHIAGMTWSNRRAIIRVKGERPSVKNMLNFYMFSNCVKIVT